MNPPKGIDPRVWGMAIEVWFDQIGMVNDRFGAVGHIGLAIQKAIEAEGEECAKVAGPTHYEGRMSDYEKQAFDIRDVISQAIRNRSNTTTERNEE